MSIIRGFTVCVSLPLWRLQQFVKLAPVVSPCHPLWSKSKTLEGPWTDIWSLGLLVLSVFLGPTTHEDRHKVDTILYWYYIAVQCECNRAFWQEEARATQKLRFCNIGEPLNKGHFGANSFVVEERLSLSRR